MKSAKQIREALSFTQSELAAAADVSLRTIKAFEAKQLTPTLRTRRKLAAAYKVTLDQVDALARGEAVEWTGSSAVSSAGPLVDALRREAAMCVSDYAIDTEPFADMLDEGERFDIDKRISMPQWIKDLRDGNLTPTVRERLERATSKTTAAA